MIEQGAILKRKLILTDIIVNIKLTTVEFFSVLFSKEKNKISNDKNVIDIDSLKLQKQSELLIQQYGNSILRLAYSYLHQLEDAEDVLQDTIIQYIKANKNFMNSNHEKAWLMRVAINISKNKIIYNKRREYEEITESFLYEEEDLKFVWEAVKSLPQNYSEVIHLFYYEGYTTIQIADFLSKKEATVRSLLHRGREKLKKVLREEYDFDE